MTEIRRAGRNGIAAVCALLLLACGGDDGPAGNAGSIQVTVNPASLPLQQGQNGVVNVALTRSGGFNGVVSLAVTGLPAGITASITPTQLSGTTTSASVAVAVGAAVTPATHTATVTATATGVNPATVTFDLTVAPTPDYTLTVTPAALPIAAGASNTTTVNIARTNFTGGVALALLNPPAGITGAFNPTPSTTNTSALTVSVAANVAAGAYPLTIQGTATGPGVKTTTLALTVTAPPTPTAVEYQFCDVSSAPVFFGYQDGTGAWQAATRTASGNAIKYTFTLTQGRGGVLIVYQTSSPAVNDAVAMARTASSRRTVKALSRARRMITARRDGANGRSAMAARSTFLADTYVTEVLYASAAELAQDGNESCALTQPTKSVTGTVLGVSSGQYGNVSLGGISDLFIGGTSSNPVTFEGVPPGPLDFVGSRWTPGNAPDRIVVFRNVNAPDGGSLPSPIDFNGPASSVPATATATINGSGGDELEIFIDVITANTDALLWFDLAPSPATTRPWAGLGPTLMQTTDFHGIYAFADARPLDSGNYRFALKYVGPVANQVLSLGPPLSTPTTSQVAGGTYPRFRFQGTVPTEYNKGVSVDVFSTENSGNVLSVIATSAFFTTSGTSTVFDITMPDIVGVAGFPTGARLTAGENNVSVSVFGFTGPGTFDIRPTLGGEFRAAIKPATIVAP